tara:strand:- start:665 stop:1087 length:423 start_codon:yes stop_codon:yes gene_type:complete
MRPTYEKKSDLINEAGVATLFGEKFGVTMLKTSVHNSYDYSALVGDVTQGLVEIKCRTNKHDKYRDYLISKQKVDTVIREAENFGVKMWLVVRFTDGVYYRSISEVDMPLKTETGGRKDRNDARDIEPVYLIPIRTFRKL